MEKIINSTLKIQIEAYLTKFADPTLKHVKKWLFERTKPGTEVLSNINYLTFHSFIDYNMITSFVSLTRGQRQAKDQQEESQATKKSDFE